MASRDSALNRLSVLLYIVVSSAFITFNKWVFSMESHSFLRPITLALIQMTFQTVVSFRLSHVDEIRPEDIDFELHYDWLVWASICLIMLLCSATSTSIQILKVLFPAAFYLVRALRWNRRLRFIKFLTILINTVGYNIAVSGLKVTHFVKSGVMCIVFASASAIQMLAVSGFSGVPSQPAIGTWSIGFTPTSFLSMLLPWIYQDELVLGNFPDIQYHFKFWKFLAANSVLVPALYFSSIFVIRRTNGITYQIAGIVKDCIVIFLSTLVFEGSKITNQNTLGYAIALSGSMMYYFLAFRGRRRAERIV